MSEKNPQDRTSAERRASDGTFVSGGGSANPGGQPKWMKQFRDLLKGLAPETEELARKVVRRALDTKALEALAANENTSDEARLAAEKAIATRIDQGIKMTAEVWQYILTKPKATLKVQGDAAHPLAGFSPEQLLALATKKPEEGK